MNQAAPHTNALAARQYRLSCNAQAQYPTWSILRSGPANPLQIGVNQSPEDALKLASLLFPLCPRAHTAAALNAIEHVSLVNLSEAQHCARASIVLAEAIAACVWRMGLQWTELLQQPGLVDPIAQARAASETLRQAIFPADWSKIGGADIHVDHMRLASSVNALDHSLIALSPIAESVMSQASQLDLETSREFGVPALSDGILDPDLKPEIEQREESVRTQMRTDAVTGLSDWFRAQSQLPRILLERLKAKLAKLNYARPTANLRLRDGTGLGIAQTARGRLRHVLSVQDGKIAYWQAHAPTDWNFATSGPAVQAFNALRIAPDNAKIARWIIAAFDPCAPCEVSHA